MSIDTAFARLREANPVPQPAALRDAPMDAPGFLLATRQRSRDMQTEMQQEEIATPQPTPARRRLVPAVAAFVVVAVAVGVGLVLTNESGSDAARAEEVAQAFFDAKNRGDADAVIALFAPDAVVDDQLVGDSIEGYRADIAWAQAVGGTETVSECTTNPASQSSSRHLLGYEGIEANCSYILENDWTRALGTRTFDTSDYRFVVEEGLIVHLIHDPDAAGSGFSQAWEAFRSWLFANHPENVGTLYDVGETAPKKDAAALELWAQRTAEFVAEQGG